MVQCRAPLFLFLLVVGLLAVPPARAQEDDTLPADEARAIRDGQAETLEARYRAPRTPEQTRRIAQAYANRARRARTAQERERALKSANEQYTQWIEAVEKQVRRGGDAKSDLELASARIEYAGMLMGLSAAAELDEFEITNGQRGDRAQLQKVLEAARTEYADARTIVSRLYDSLADREDEYLAAGIYDTIIQRRLDIILNDGWAHYYLGLIEENDQRKRAEYLRTAEERFQSLIDSGQTGQMLFQCYLGLAMAQREQGRYSDAEQNFRRSRQEGADFAVTAQSRCEESRLHAATGKFAEARAVLEPLLKKDQADLTASERAARFYLNLALLLDGNSYLKEATTIQKEADKSTARTAILRQAERAREIGLSKLNRLAARGGAWPAIVQVYVSAAVNLNADPKTLTPTELLFTARQLVESKDYKGAQRRLEEALSRPEFAPDKTDRDEADTEIAGQLLMEIGKCYYRLDELRRAADAFDRLASEFRAHEHAEQAATFAYQLRVEIARESGEKPDYSRLADTLRNLLENYPRHPQRDEAEWLLPVALQAAGRYAAATNEFSKISEKSPRYEEAQFRQLQCARLGLEQHAGAEADGYRAKAQEIAANLLKYAKSIEDKAAGLTRTEAKDMLGWAAEARVNAAELLASQGVEQHQQAIDAIADFETQYPDSDLQGRVLATRIRAYRGLREFERATEILQQFLSTAPPERAGAVLASLARGMQEEVERLSEAGQPEAAQQLAAESVETFNELEKWLRQDEKRAAQVDAVLYGKAQMLRAAGRSDEARELASTLLKKQPQNGNYQRLLAEILTANLGDAAAPADITAAKDAWGELLKDPSMRKRAPQRYWEARYNWLALRLRESATDTDAAAEVAKAIKEQGVWFPDLGGPEWKEKLLALRKDALAKAGLPADDAEGDAPAEP